MKASGIVIGRSYWHERHGMVVPTGIALDRGRHLLKVRGHGLQELLVHAGELLSAEAPPDPDHGESAFAVEASTGFVVGRHPVIWLAYDTGAHSPAFVPASPPVSDPAPAPMAIVPGADSPLPTVTVADATGGDAPVSVFCLECLDVTRLDAAYKATCGHATWTSDVAEVVEGLRGVEDDRRRDAAFGACLRLGMFSAPGWRGRALDALGRSWTRSADVPGPASTSRGATSPPWCRRWSGVSDDRVS